MHTVIVLAVGFGLFALCALVGHVVGDAPGVATAALAFPPLWFVGAGINMYVGVKRAGYSVSEESPIFLVAFGVPATAALLAWWQLR
jgi:hypothetical protein